MKFIVLHIEGGIGKNILATAVVKAIKKHYTDREIIITTAWEEVWQNNKDIYRVYKFENSPYFYEDYIKDKDTIVFMHNPYHSTEHLYQSEHIIETWCKLCGVSYNGETPQINLTPREIDLVKNTIVAKGDKPIFLLQTNGGMDALPYSWARDLPIATANEIVQQYKDKYRIIHIRREDQLSIADTEYLNLTIRQIFALLLFSHKRLFIDSFCQHAAAALELPSTVVWMVNKPEVFGYDLHKNIRSEVSEDYQTTKYSYLSKYNIGGAINEFPYNTRDLFDVNKILDSLQ